jgi:hypothetical protein
VFAGLDGEIGVVLDLVILMDRCRGIGGCSGKRMRRRAAENHTGGDQDDGNLAKQQAHDATLAARKDGRQSVAHSRTICRGGT